MRQGAAASIGDRAADSSSDPIGLLLYQSGLLFHLGRIGVDCGLMSSSAVKPNHSAMALASSWVKWPLVDCGECGICGVISSHWKDSKEASHLKPIR